MGRPTIDLTGHRFGRLTVVDQAPNRNGKTMWLCRCDCGNEKVVIGDNLRFGTSKSCGCLRSERAFEAQTKHGERGTRLYRIWLGMKTRCGNRNSINYVYYGGRGITVCAEWLNDFATFRNWAISHGYADNLTIDRIDSDGDYSPDNCRWITRAENTAKANKNRKRQ